MDDKSKGELYVLVTNASSVATKARKFKDKVKNPEQIYTVIDNVIQCVSTKDPTFTSSGTGKIVGGTGRYEGATGRLTFKSKGQFGQITPKGYMGVISANKNIVSP